MSSGNRKQVCIDNSDQGGAKQMKMTGSAQSREVLEPPFLEVFKGCVEHGTQGHDSVVGLVC